MSQSDGRGQCNRKADRLFRRPVDNLMTGLFRDGHFIITREQGLLIFFQVDLQLPLDGSSCFLQFTMEVRTDLRLREVKR